MKIHYKKTGVAILCTAFLFLATGAFAQKSVYDVVPGSGPKNRKVETNRKPTTSLPDIFKGTNNKRNDERIFRGNRRNLPPGQAKKIYGGSAKDYAPGQLKKHRSWKHSRHWDNDDKRNHGHHKKQGKEKHNKEKHDD